MNVDNRKEHFLSDAELTRLLDVLRSDPNRPICNLCLFLLSTGARLNEALKAKWVHFNRAKRMWEIPAAVAKSRRSRWVPLNDSALQVLDEIGTEGHHEYVFANPKTGKPFVNVRKVWVRLRKDAGLPDLRLHDLRHGFASLLVSSGRTLYEVQAILGHSDPKVTMRYSHLSSSALQEAASSASLLVKPSKAA